MMLCLPSEYRPFIEAKLAEIQTAIRDGKVPEFMTDPGAAVGYVVIETRRIDRSASFDRPMGVLEADRLAAGGSGR